MLPPPQPIATTPVRKINRPNVDFHPRRLPGTAKKSRQANTAPPAAVYQRWERGYASALVEGAVVETVAVVVAAVVPLTVTDDALSATVGRLVAPAGLVVSDAVRLTAPVKPLAGVTATVEVLPDVAPGATVTVVPETVKVGGGGAATVTTTADEVEAAKVLLPAYAAVMEVVPTGNVSVV
jgi:hypothetical protein